jgi:hypothetical protein
VATASATDIFWDGNDAGSSINPYEAAGAVAFVRGELSFSTISVGDPLTRQVIGHLDIDVPSLSFSPYGYMGISVSDSSTVSLDQVWTSTTTPSTFTLDIRDSGWYSIQLYLVVEVPHGIDPTDMASVYMSLSDLSPDVVPVPEPASLALLAAGAATALARRSAR